LQGVIRVVRRRAGAWTTIGKLGRVVMLGPVAATPDVHVSPLDAAGHRKTFAFMIHRFQ
jgi:uncharacterized membrane protein YadS